MANPSGRLCLDAEGKARMDQYGQVLLDNPAYLCYAVNYWYNPVLGYNTEMQKVWGGGVGGGYPNPATQAQSLCTTIDHKILAACHGYGYEANNALVKLDNSGRELWIFNTGYAGTGVASDPQSRAYLLGQSDTYNQGVWKVSAEGEQIWFFDAHNWDLYPAVACDHTATEEHPWSASRPQDAVYFGRSYDGGTSYYCVTKLDKDGNFLWGYPYDWSGGLKNGYRIAVGTDGNVVALLAAESVADKSLLKLSPSGSLLWSKTRAQTGELYGVVIDENYNIYTVGTRDVGNVNIRKFTPSGTQVAAYDTGSVYRLVNLTFDPAGDILTTGYPAGGKATWKLDRDLALLDSWDIGGTYCEDIAAVQVMPE